MSYQIMTVDGLIEYCKNYKWTRRPKELHIHHTWKPSHKDFKGNNHLAMQESMANYHKGKGWEDIGQHLSLFPDGKFATGRSFNKNPASIKGRNSLGFAIEMIGDFDIGHDVLDGDQLESIIKFSAFFIEFFKLDADNNIKFHNEYASKSCPGTGINKNKFVNMVKEGEDMLTPYTVIVDGIKQEAFLKDGKTLVWLRDITKALSPNAKISSDPANKKAMVNTK